MKRQVLVTTPRLVVHVKAVRDDQGQLILGTGHGHVQQPSLFLDIVEQQ